MTENIKLIIVNAATVGAEGIDCICDFCDEQFHFDDVDAFWKHECFDLYDRNADYIVMDENNKVSGVSKKEWDRLANLQDQPHKNRSACTEGNWTLEDQTKQSIILHVQTRTVLWNFNEVPLQDRGRVQVGQYWNQVATAAGVSVDEAKLMWKQLKKQYRTAKTKKEKAERMPSANQGEKPGSEGAIEDGFKFYDLMTFLDEKVDENVPSTSSQQASAGAGGSLGQNRQFLQPDNQTNQKKSKGEDDESFQDRLLKLAFGGNKAASDNAPFLGMLDQLMNTIPMEYRVPIQLDVLKFLREKIVNP